MLADQKQNAWKIPALLNLVLGGMGTGFYLISLLIFLPPNADWLQVAVYKMLGPILLGTGLFSLTIEAGHPMKSIYLLANLRHSWMSREALAGGLFMLFAGLDWLMPSPVLQGIAAVAGLMFTFSQGMIVWRASGILTWDTPVSVVFFVTSSLSTGGGVMLIVNSIYGLPSVISIPLVVFVIALVNVLVWLVYLNLPGKAFQKGITPLRQANQLWLTLGLGHSLPLLALLLPLPIAIPLAGFGLVYGGIRQKFSFTFDASTIRSVIQK